MKEDTDKKAALRSTDAQPNTAHREESLSGEALVMLAVIAQEELEESAREIAAAKLEDQSDAEEGLLTGVKKNAVNNEQQKGEAHIYDGKECSKVDEVGPLDKSNMGPSDLKRLEVELVKISTTSQHTRSFNKSSKSLLFEEQAALDLVHCTEQSIVPVRMARMSNDETDEEVAPNSEHGAFAMPGLSYRDPPARQATQAVNLANNRQGGNRQEANPWMPDDSNGQPVGDSRGLDTTQGHRASTLFRNLLMHRGDPSRNSSGVTNNMAIAQSVDDAEAVVYASKVEKARPKWVNWCLTASAIAIILSLSLSLALTLGSPDDAAIDLGDPRCIKNIADQDIMDICHCTGNASGLVFVGNETKLYNTLHAFFVVIGLMNQIYPRDSCAFEHQALISLANFERYDVDFSSGIGFVTQEPEVMNHPNVELLQTYGIDVVQQQYIIELLYIQLGGENWPRRENWMDTALVCDFEGVSCALMERIQSISLPANNLTGPLPTQLGRMKYLRTLDLSNNPHLTGSIPTNFGAMESLREIDLSSCSLAGTLPTELGNIVGMDRMLLYNNTISGNIPEEFGNMERVRELNFNTNRLQGALPSGMFSMTSMESLQIKNNSFTGTIPEEIGRLNYLETLDISYNNFTGPLPDVLGNFSRLNLFSLSNNQLSGSITEGYCEANNDRSILNIIITDCNVDRNCSCCRRTAVCVENLPSLGRGVL